jgi:hypothetical protein
LPGALRPLRFPSLTFRFHRAPRGAVQAKEAKLLATAAAAAMAESKAAAATAAMADCAVVVGEAAAAEATAATGGGRDAAAAQAPDKTPQQQQPPQQQQQQQLQQQTLNPFFMSVVSRAGNEGDAPVCVLSAMCLLACCGVLSTTWCVLYC